MFACVKASAKGWGEISPLPGFSQETWEEAQSVLLAWVNNWLAGDCELPQMPSVAFGVSCALAELADTLPQAANYRTAPALMAIRRSDPQTCRYARRESGEGQSGIVRSRARRHGG